MKTQSAALQIAALTISSKLPDDSMLFRSIGGVTITPL
jgi:hypothetical protein